MASLIDVTRPAQRLIGVLLVVLMAACGTERSADTTTTVAETEAPTASAPPFPGNTPLQFAENSGEWDLALTDVRVEQHEGFDRLVLEFTGTGVPGWAVGYVEKPVLDGSGDAVSVGGDTFVDIYASGVIYPVDGYDGGPRHVETEKRTVEDVYVVAGPFEGYQQVIAGIEGARVPFRAFALPDPPRLVVDVADGSTPTSPQ
jgi:hypothetical protein